MKVPKQIPVELNQLKLRFENWRKTRTKRVLSELLWQEAVELSRILGVSLVSRTLGLNYEELSSRVGERGKSHRASPSSVDKVATAKPKFVEVQRMPMMEGNRGKTAHIRVQCGFGKNLDISLNNPDASDWENVFSGLARAQLDIRVVQS